MLETADLTAFAEAFGISEKNAAAGFAKLEAAGWTFSPPKPLQAEVQPSTTPLATETNWAGVQSIIAYTDGAAPGNGTTGGVTGGWAFALIHGDDILEQKAGRELATTNNRMELRAIEEAIAAVPGHIAVEIRTDSANAIGWLDQGFKRKDPQIATACARIDSLRRDRPAPVSFTKVRGHDKDYLNNLVDAAAVTAVDSTP